MPFIVAIQISPRQKLFLRRDGDDFIPTPARARATPLSELKADQVAAEHARYASTPAEVEGVKAT